MHFLYKSVYENIRRGAPAAHNSNPTTNASSNNNDSNNNNTDLNDIHASDSIAIFKAVFGDDADFRNSNEHATNEVAFAFNIRPTELDKMQKALEPWRTHKVVIAGELGVDRSASVITIYQKALKEKLVITPTSASGWADFEAFKEKYEESYDEL